VGEFYARLGVSITLLRRSSAWKGIDINVSTIPETSGLKEKMRFRKVHTVERGADGVLYSALLLERTALRGQSKVTL